MNAAERDPDDRLAGAATRRRGGGAWRVVVSLVAVAVSAVLFGFLMFASHAMRGPEPIRGRADGIIVLTGGDHRIVEGARLLRENAARRLLISGVNPQTSRDDIIKLSGLDTHRFHCCVDLGYAAQDTIGNAEEARNWAAGIAARRLIVVTSGYHMPRSLAELAIAMPDTEFIPHPVIPRAVRERAWWLQPGLARLLATEYVKFLPVAARYAVARHVTPMISRAQSVDNSASAAAR